MRCSLLPRLLPPLVTSLLTFLAFGIGSPAAFAAVQNRITLPVSSYAPVEIPNSVHPRVRLATDLGPAPADTRLVGMTIRFNMTTAQQAALDQLLADLQDPASPRYHQWLTPTQFGAQFGLSSADIAQVTAWLTSQGFTVTGVANGGTFITFDGTVAQAKAAFSTSIHNLSLNGETHFANVTNPSVPGAIAGVVSAITGLHDFHPKPRIRTSAATPQFTSSISGNHYLAPGRHLHHLRRQSAADRRHQRRGHRNRRQLPQRAHRQLRRHRRHRPGGHQLRRCRRLSHAPPGLAPPTFPPQCMRAAIPATPAYLRQLLP